MASNLKDRYPDTNHSPPKRNPLCQSLGFLCGVYEASVFLGYDAVSIGIWFPTFREYVEETKNVKQDLDFSTPGDEPTMLSGHIRNQIPSNTASYLKRTDTKSTLSFTHHSDPTNTAYLCDFTAPFTTLHLQDQHTITYT
jgi:hypothetical protein